MSLRGGGTAGGSAPGKAAPQFVRQVPKFLQKYQHLMGRGGGGGDGNEDPLDSQQKISEIQRERMRAQAAQDEFEDDLQGATIVRDESGVGLGDEDASELLQDPGWLKDQGNAAYSRGDHEEAVGYFTRAIRQDPSNAVLYSNRSAAQAALKRFDLALQDGKKALQFQPRWPKAYSRIGAAYFGLERYDEAMAAYEKGVQCDPKNTVCIDGAKQARDRLLRADEKEAQSGKHTFRKRKAEEKGDGGIKKRPQDVQKDLKNGLELKRAKPSSVSELERRKKALVSFADDEEA